MIKNINKRMECTTVIHQLIKFVCTITETLHVDGTGSEFNFWICEQIKTKILEYNFIHYPYLSINKTLVNPKPQLLQYITVSLI